jgi:hypothetical protein
MKISVVICVFFICSADFLSVVYGTQFIPIYINNLILFMYRTEIMAAYFQGDVIFCVHNFLEGSCKLRHIQINNLKRN